MIDPDPNGALWRPRPERARRSWLAATMAHFGVEDYPALHRLSVAEPERFWRHVWEDAGVVGTPGDRTIVPGDRLADTRFFPDATLNVAATLLSRTGDTPALIFRGEGDRSDAVTWDELHALVSQWQGLLRAAGVGVGDRVAAWMPHTPQTIAVMVAAAGLGAVFTSTSPDFGADGVIDRFGQVEPKVLVATDGYSYGGRWFSCLERLDEIRAALGPAVHTVVVPFDGPVDALEPFPAGPVHLEPLPFDHPWVVLYSSGTTGKPKCIVHRAGGVLLKHLSEHRLHCDVAPGDRILYFTTAGWMMWNWVVSGLAAGATVVCYDGSPFHPDGNRLFDIVDELGISLLGVSAKFIDSCAKAGLRPVDTHRLEHLRTICSTGSPLTPESFAYVYDAVHPDVHLASISGGTDLCGCLVAGDPTSPVYAGEIQRAALGLDIGVLDDAGEPLGAGEQGELTCATPFPSMPLGFWNDDDGARYRAAYFERFPGRWHQGDFASWTEHGGIVIHGRSDATLNPGGVRIGTAEITRQVDTFDEVTESLVIGQQVDGDVRVVLFVRLAEGATLTDALQAAIKARVRNEATPRHVPAIIVAVDDLPRTRSGKLSELAVRDVVHGRRVTNVEALANPESLELFADLAELA